MHRGLLFHPKGRGCRRRSLSPPKEQEQRSRPSSFCSGGQRRRKRRPPTLAQPARPPTPSFAPPKNAPERSPARRSHTPLPILSAGAALGNCSGRRKEAGQKTVTSRRPRYGPAQSSPPFLLMKVSPPPFLRARAPGCPGEEFVPRAHPALEPGLRTRQALLPSTHLCARPRSLCLS